MGLACTAGDPPDFLQGSSQLAVVVLCRGPMGDRWKSTLQFQRLVALSTMTGWLYHPVSWDDDIPNIRRPRQTQGGVRKGKRVYDTAARKE